MNCVFERLGLSCARQKTCYKRRQFNTCQEGQIWQLYSFTLPFGVHHKFYRPKSAMHFTLVIILLAYYMVANTHL